MKKKTTMDKIRLALILIIIILLIKTGLNYTGFRKIEFVKDPNHNDKWLKELVIKDNPELLNPNVSDYEKVNLIREWAAMNTLVARKRSIKLDDPKKNMQDPNYYKQNASIIYYSFIMIKGGVWCGGTSYALAKLYELFGYESIMMNIDLKKGKWSHALNLVKINEDDKSRYVIQDAYLNSTFVHKNGSPLDYFDMIELLRQRKHGGIRIKGSTSESNSMREYIDSDLFGNTIRKIEKLMTLDDYEEVYKKEFTTFYKENNYPENNLYTYLAFDRIYDGSESPQTKADFLQKMYDHGILFSEND